MLRLMRPHLATPGAVVRALMGAAVIDVVVYELAGTVTAVLVYALVLVAVTRMVSRGG